MGLRKNHKFDPSSTDQANISPLTRTDVLKAARYALIDERRRQRAMKRGCLVARLPLDNPWIESELPVEDQSPDQMAERYELRSHVDHCLD